MCQHCWQSASFAGSLYSFIELTLMKCYPYIIWHCFAFMLDVTMLNGSFKFSLNGVIQNYKKIFPPVFFIMF